MKKSALVLLTIVWIVCVLVQPVALAAGSVVAGDMNGDGCVNAGDQIVIFYGSNTWSYTRLGHVDLTQEEMTELLGNGDVIVTISD